MADFWENTWAQVQQGASKFIEQEIERHTTPAVKEEPKPDGTKTVLESLQAQMKSTTTLYIVVGLFIIAAVFMAGGRRGR